MSEVTWVGITLLFLLSDSVVLARLALRSLLDDIILKVVDAGPPVEVGWEMMTPLPEAVELLEGAGKEKEWGPPPVVVALLALGALPKVKRGPGVVAVGFVGFSKLLPNRTSLTISAVLGSGVYLT